MLENVILARSTVGEPTTYIGVLQSLLSAWDVKAEVALAGEDLYSSSTRWGVCPLSCPVDIDSQTESMYRFREIQEDHAQATLRYAQLLFPEKDTVVIPITEYQALKDTEFRYDSLCD
jgi:hypothetical protein